MPHRDTRALVAHLFRRAGFGLRPEELDHFTGLGIRGSVEYLLNYDAVPDPAETRFPLPDLGPLSSTLNALFAELDQSRPDRAELIRQLRATLDQAKLLLQSWWINRMLHTNRPLQEKMTLFWHGHFATALQKVDAAQMLPQNLLFRSMALGNFGTLLAAVTRDAAMLHWLDGDLNRKGHPNENYAREVMELFTLGVGHYTEHDVREGARALTGWVLELFTYKPRWVPRYHDDGIKTYLGHTGNFGPDEIMDILAAHPRTGVFLARKLFEFFAHDNADAATVQQIADTYYRSGHDIKAVVRQILLSDAFYSEASFQQHFRSPAEFVVGTVRELGVAAPPAAMAQIDDRDGPGPLQPAQRGRLAGRLHLGHGQGAGGTLQLRRPTGRAARCRGQPPGCAAAAAQERRAHGRRAGRLSPGPLHRPGCHRGDARGPD